MSTKQEKSLIRQGLASISKGDATGLKKSIREALFAKVRRKLEEKEKVLAKTMFKEIKQDD